MSSTSLKRKASQSMLDAESRDLYRQTKLSRNSREIRVLELLPTSSNDYGDLTIRIKLQHTYDLDVACKTGDYEALSYCWGELDNTCKISANGKPLYVRGNLYNALLHLRQPEKVRCLWIDAICINQGDDKERTEQVSMMATIYKNATRTVVWLGLDSAEGDGICSIHFLEWLGALVWLRGRPPLDTKTLRNFMDEYNAKLRILDPRITRDLLALFASRAYFRRRWVVQEIARAKSVEIICGSYHTRDPRIFDAWSYMIDDDDSPFAVTHPFIRLIRLRATYSSLQSGPETILDALHDFRDFQCKDPRDRIAAMLWKAEETIRVDYSSSTEQVYEVFARQIVQTADVSRIKDLLFAAARRSYDFQATLFLPSWVPDWRVDPREGAVELEPPEESRNLLYATSVSVVWTVNTPPSYSIANSVLDLEFRRCICLVALISAQTRSLVLWGDCLICFKSDKTDHLYDANSTIPDLGLVLRPLSSVRNTWRLVGSTRLELKAGVPRNTWPRDHIEKRSILKFRIQ